MTERSGITARKNRSNPQNIKPVFTNDYVIQHTPTEFYFSLYAFEPPLLITEDDVEALEKNPVVEVELISKHVFTPIE